MLRYSGRSIANYSFALKCLAYESLRLVQNSGNGSERRLSLLFLAYQIIAHHAHVFMLQIMAMI